MEDLRISYPTTLMPFRDGRFPEILGSFQLDKHNVEEWSNEDDPTLKHRARKEIGKWVNAQRNADIQIQREDDLKESRKGLENQRTETIQGTSPDSQFEIVRMERDFKESGGGESGEGSSRSRISSMSTSYQMSSSRGMRFTSKTTSNKTTTTTTTTTDISTSPRIMPDKGNDFENLKIESHPLDTSRQRERINVGRSGTMGVRRPPTRRQSNSQQEKVETQPQSFNHQNTSRTPSIPTENNDLSIVTFKNISPKLLVGFPAEIQVELRNKFTAREPGSVEDVKEVEKPYSNLRTMSAMQLKSNNPESISVPHRRSSVENSWNSMDAQNPSHPVSKSTSIKNGLKPLSGDSEPNISYIETFTPSGLSRSWDLMQRFGTYQKVGMESDSAEEEGKKQWPSFCETMDNLPDRKRVGQGSWEPKKKVDDINQEYTLDSLEINSEKNGQHSYSYGKSKNNRFSPDFNEDIFTNLCSESDKLNNWESEWEKTKVELNRLHESINLSNSDKDNKVRNSPNDPNQNPMTQRSIYPFTSRSYLNDENKETYFNGMGILSSGGTSLGRYNPTPVSENDQDSSSTKISQTWISASDTQKPSRHAQDNELSTSISATSDPSKRALRKVEFCKTEVHFPPEPGKFHIVESDENKPSTVHLFRRRKRKTSLENKGHVDDLSQLPRRESRKEDDNLGEPSTTIQSSRVIDLEEKMDASTINNGEWLDNYSTSGNGQKEEAAIRPIVSKPLLTSDLAKLIKNMEPNVVTAAVAVEKAQAQPPAPSTLWDEEAPVSTWNEKAQPPVTSTLLNEKAQPPATSTLWNEKAQVSVSTWNEKAQPPVSTWNEKAQPPVTSTLWNDIGDLDYEEDIVLNPIPSRSNVSNYEELKIQKYLNQLKPLAAARTESFGKAVESRDPNYAHNQYILDRVRTDYEEAEVDEVQAQDQNEQDEDEDEDELHFRYGSFVPLATRQSLIEMNNRNRMKYLNYSTTNSQMSDVSSTTSSYSLPHSENSPYEKPLKPFMINPYETNMAESSRNDHHHHHPHTQDINFLERDGSNTILEDRGRDRIKSLRLQSYEPGKLSQIPAPVLPFDHNPINLYRNGRRSYSASPIRESPRIYPKPPTPILPIQFSNFEKTGEALRSRVLSKAPKCTCTVTEDEIPRTATVSETKPQRLPTLKTVVNIVNDDLDLDNSEGLEDQNESDAVATTTSKGTSIMRSMTFPKSSRLEPEWVSKARAKAKNRESQGFEWMQVGQRHQVTDTECANTDPPWYSELLKIKHRASPPGDEILSKPSNVYPWQKDKVKLNGKIQEEGIEGAGAERGISDTPTPVVFLQGPVPEPLAEGIYKSHCTISSSVANNRSIVDLNRDLESITINPNQIELIEQAQIQKSTAKSTNASKNFGSITGRGGHLRRGSPISTGKISSLKERTKGSRNSGESDGGPVSTSGRKPLQTSTTVNQNLVVRLENGGAHNDGQQKPKIGPKPPKPPQRISSLIKPASLGTTLVNPSPEKKKKSSPTPRKGTNQAQNLGDNLMETSRTSSLLIHRHPTIKISKLPTRTSPSSPKSPSPDGMEPLKKKSHVSLMTEAKRICKGKASSKSLIDSKCGLGSRAQGQQSPVSASSSASPQQRKR